jgi:hypothetical protein
MTCTSAASSANSSISRASSVKVSRRRIRLFPSVHQTANQSDRSYFDCWRPYVTFESSLSLSTMPLLTDAFGQGLLPLFPKNMGNHRLLHPTGKNSTFVQLPMIKMITVVRLCCRAPWHLRQDVPFHGSVHENESHFAVWYWTISRNNNFISVGPCFYIVFHPLFIPYE